MFDQYGDFKRQLPDRDPAETRDWVDSLDSVVENEGRARAQFILYRLLKRARQLNLGLPPLTADALHQHHLARAGARRSRATRRWSCASGA